MIYVFLVGSILALSPLLGSERSPNAKKIYYIIIAAEIILASGLRDWSVGADTLAYQVRFRTLPPWEDVIYNFMHFEGKDPGYNVFQRIAYIVIKDYQLYLMFIAIIFTVPLGIYIYKNSKMPMLSFLLYIALFFPFFSITGHRQTVATALCLISYEFVKKRWLVPFLLLTGIASTIHISALAFIPFYFLGVVKITKASIAFTVLVVIISFVARQQIFDIVKMTVEEYSRYEYYPGAGTYVFTTVLFLLTCVALWRAPNILEQSPNATHYFNALFISWMFIPLTFVNPSAMRIPQYYTLFLMLLVPEIFESFLPKDKMLVMYVIVVSLLFLGLRDPWVSSYRFFFQL